jgi:hypothetical protein
MLKFLPAIGFYRKILILIVLKDFYKINTLINLVLKSYPQSNDIIM